MLDDRLDQVTQRVALISLNEQQLECIHVVYPDWSTISPFESRALDSFLRSVLPSFRYSISPLPYFCLLASLRVSPGYCNVVTTFDASIYKVFPK